MSQNKSYASNVWKRTSSREGVKTTQHTPNGSSDNVCTTGNANAAVLPDPVLAYLTKGMEGEGERGMEGSA